MKQLRSEPNSVQHHTKDCSPLFGVDIHLVRIKPALRPEQLKIKYSTPGDYHPHLINGQVMGWSR